MEKRLFVECETYIQDTTNGNNIMLMRFLPSDYITKSYEQVLEKLLTEQVDAIGQLPYNQKQKTAVKKVREDLKRSTQTSDAQHLSVSVYDLNSVGSVPTSVRLEDTLNAAFLGEKSHNLNDDTVIDKTLKLILDIQATGGYF